MTLAAVSKPTWNDLARSVAWYALGREISPIDADWLLWERTCFPCGDRSTVERQLRQALT